MTLFIVQITFYNISYVHAESHCDNSLRITPPSRGDRPEHPCRQTNRLCFDTAASSAESSSPWIVSLSNKVSAA